MIRIKIGVTESKQRITKELTEGKQCNKQVEIDPVNIRCPKLLTLDLLVRPPTCPKINYKYMQEPA